MQSFVAGFPATVAHRGSIECSSHVRCCPPSPPRGSLAAPARRAFFAGGDAHVLGTFQLRAAHREVKWTAPLPGTAPARPFVVQAAAVSGESSSPAPKRFQLLQSLPGSLRRWGWFGFWAQLVLCSISSMILLFSRAFQDPYATGAAAGAASGVAGLSSALLGLGCSFLSLFWQYGYIRLAKRVRRREQELVGQQEGAGGTLPVLEEELQGKFESARGEVARSLKIGLFINLVGMFLTLIGAEATIGVLMGKALAQGVVNPWGAAPGRFVQALDIFIVQANTNTLFSHFVGLCVGLRLLNKLAAVRGPRPAPQ
eukprot:tig00000903_g5499.t1